MIARLHIRTGRLRWVNAGHPSPLILRAGSLLEPPCGPPDAPLGLLTELPTPWETNFNAWESIVIYTDGVVEARSPDGEFFGEAALRISFSVPPPTTTPHPR